MKITIYTDGSSKGNPGPGGYGVVMMAGKYYKEIAEGFLKTTNNRMELLSVIIALETIKTEGAEVEVFSDSKYVVDAVEKGWVFNWVKKNFKDKKNPDLWRRFLKVYPKHKVKLNWVKGHAGNKYNEICDRLAFNIADSKNLKKDEGYEAQSSNNDIFTAK